MTNTTLKHINRNMRNLDEIIRQIETTQRIQRPSDDPIRASRSMKFRTNMAENEQFHRNVLNGMAWMNVTESAFNNINAELLRTIRELTVQAANGTLDSRQMQGVVAQMQTLFQQIGHEMNATYAGSHLFSGFRTDEPPVFNRDNNRSFMITQNFNLSDISRGQSFQRLPNADGLVESHVEYVNVINLAFRGLDTWPPAGPPAGWPATGTITNPPGINVPGFNIVKISNQNPDAYRPPEVVPPAMPTLHFIYETGELVMHETVTQIFPREGISVTYQKTGFRQGDINPAVYFNAREVISDPHFSAIDDANVSVTYRVTQNLSRAAGTEQADGSIQFTLAHTPAHAGVTNGLFDDMNTLRNLIPSFNPPVPNGQLPPGVTLVGDVLTVPPGFFDTVNNFSITYSVVDPTPGDIPGFDVANLPNGAAEHSSIMHDTRLQGVELVRAISTNAASGHPVGTNIPLDQVINHRSFSMDNQSISLEFSAHTHVPINSLAKNVLTDKMFADFRRLFEFSDSIATTERAVLRQHFEGPPHFLTGEALENAVTNQENLEESMATAALHNKFNNMLFLIDRHADNASREQTLLGSRMVRLDMLESRLEQDAVTFELLIRDNDATDIPLALIRKASAEAAFMASLRANSGVVQMSLAQFIN